MDDTSSYAYYPSSNITTQTNAQPSGSTPNPFANSANIATCAAFRGAQANIYPSPPFRSEGEGEFQNASPLDAGQGCGEWVAYDSFAEFLLSHHGADTQATYETVGAEYGAGALNEFTSSEVHHTEGSMGASSGTHQTNLLIQPSVPSGTSSSHTDGFDKFYSQQTDLPAVDTPGLAPTYTHPTIAWDNVQAQFTAPVDRAPQLDPTQRELSAPYVTKDPQSSASVSAREPLSDLQPVSAAPPPLNHTESTQFPWSPCFPPYTGSGFPFYPQTAEKDHPVCWQERLRSALKPDTSSQSAPTLQQGVNAASHQAHPQIVDTQPIVSLDVAQTRGATQVNHGASALPASSSSNSGTGSKHSTTSKNGVKRGRGRKAAVVPDDETTPVTSKAKKRKAEPVTETYNGIKFSHSISSEDSTRTSYRNKELIWDTRGIGTPENIADRVKRIRSS